MGKLQLSSSIAMLLENCWLFQQNLRRTDFEVALVYPLTSVPLSLSNPDGSRRVTQKSKLMEVLSQYQEENDVVVEIDAKIVVVDFIAQIRVITKEIPRMSSSYLKFYSQYQKAMSVLIWLLILIV